MTSDNDSTAASVFAKGDEVDLYLRGEFADRVRWLGPTGRDDNGRFVRRGSPTEAIMLDGGLTYTRLDVDRGAVHIEPVKAASRH